MLAWASVRKCPLNPAVVMPAVRPSGEEETRRMGLLVFETGCAVQSR
jgi:hypothetical protein